MSELKPCPFCGSEMEQSEISVGMALCSNENCWFYAVYIPVTVLNTRPIEDKLQAELSRRDEIITRLKEDGERLANDLILEFCDGDFECQSCGDDWTFYKSGNEIVHAPDCPVTLHRALMKELAEC
jgi:hypothetical protein